MSQPHSTALTLLLPLRFLGWMPTLITAIAAALDRVMLDCRNALSEAHPASCSITLTDWERNHGLPDSCVGALATINERVAAVEERYAGQPLLCRQYYIDIAAAFGQEVLIVEGIGDDPHAWQVVYQSSVQDETFFSAGDAVAGDALIEIAPTLVACIIARLIPAHTSVSFANA